MSITTALKARRDSMQDREAGFTLIELLVVVIIIGILAAIAIPIYLGVQNNAKDSAVKSDLVNNKTAIVAYATANNGDVPTGTAAAVGTSTANYGWSQSNNTDSFVYTVTGTGTSATWCLLATGKTLNKFVITSNTPVSGGTTTTACPATN